MKNPVYRESKEDLSVFQRMILPCILHRYPKYRNAKPVTAEYQSQKSLSVNFFRYDTASFSGNPFYKYDLPKESLPNRNIVHQLN